MIAPKKIWLTPPEATFVGWTTIEKHARPCDTPYIRADIVEEMRKELSMALNVFRSYQKYHQAKGSDDKAFANKSYADSIEAALKRLEEE